MGGKNLPKSPGGDSKVLKVLTIDPGITTGFALARIEAETVDVGIFQDKLDHAPFYDLIARIAPQAIVYERFDYRNRQRAGLELYSRELIGVISLYAQWYEAQLFPQQSSVVSDSGPWSNARLQAQGYYVRGMPHGLDALRHFLQWFTYGWGYKKNHKQEIRVGKRDIAQIVAPPE
jgi:hypothetical protein